MHDDTTPKAAPVSAVAPTDLITTEQAAEILGVTPQALSQWRHRGVGPEWYQYQPQGAVRYSRAALEAWLVSRRVVPR